MPTIQVQAKVRVSAEFASEMHERFDLVIDQAAIDLIPIEDSEVSTECADPPSEKDD